ncbi:MAG: sulfatase-like hydrolase/transferase [Flavobacteriaceae bacterium]
MGKTLPLKIPFCVKRYFLLFFVLLAFAFSQAQQPNIVVILVDDAGNNDWGFQGSTVSITPTIDALAGDGTIFSQGYVTNSVCAPSRAGMLSGQYQNKLGFEYNIVAYSTAPEHTGQDVGLDPSVPTMGNYLKDLGYSTALFGKWHLGEEAHHHPNARGFDHFYGLIGGSRNYNQKETANDKKLQRNGTYVEPADNNFYVTDLLTDEVIDYIEEETTAGNPFLAFVSYTAPHGPFQAKAEDKALFDGISGLSNNQKHYYGMINCVDDNVKRIVDLLKDKNEYDNTLFVFLSDNGGVSLTTNNGMLRGHKSSQYEGGLRVPFFATWKDGGIPSGSTYNGQVISLDLVSTFVKAAGGDLTSTTYHELDGKDLVGAASTNATLHDKLFWRKKDVWSIVSDGTNKVIIDNSDDDVAITEIAHYNLDNDISETTNLYTSGSTVVSNLVADFNTWDQNNDLPSWIGNNVLSKPGVCNSTGNTSNCQFLVDRYAAFSAVTHLEENNNETLTVGKGGTEEINQLSLMYSDPIKNEAVITYILDAVPTNGTLRKNGQTLTVGDSFKQIDIRMGAITYQHDDSATTSDSFQFDVTDGSGGETIADVVYNITVDENAGKNYYVSTSGDDTNDGLSEATPWQTLAKASSAAIQPGDKVLFKRGDTFIGQLNPTYSGADGNPITFAAYGSGTQKPIITGSGAAGGDHLAAILINNQEYFELLNLEVQNERLVARTGVEDVEGYGILVLNDGSEVMHHFNFSYLTIKNVYAITTSGVSFDDLQVAGIYVRSERNTVVGEEKHVRDVKVDSCYFTRTGKFGFWSQHKNADAGIGDDMINRNMNFVFTNNHFYHTGGSGITPGRTYNCLIENNVFERTGSSLDNRMAKRGSGAWVFNCINVVAQYNKSYHARGVGDSYGMHIDSNNQYVIFQYNYSEDNMGFVEILGGNNYATYRYNISVNDGRRATKGNTFWFSSFGNGKSGNLYVYNNSVYVGNKAGSEDMLSTGLQLTSKGALIANNAIYVANGADVGYKQFNRDAPVAVDNNMYYGDVRTANFVDQDANAYTDTNPLYLNPGALRNADAYKLEETSPALGTARIITEPPFSMAGQGIFAHITANATVDYFGNPVDLTQTGVNIGAYNGAGETSQGNNVVTEPEPETDTIDFEAEGATLLGDAETNTCVRASNGEMTKGVSGGDTNAVFFENVEVTTAGNYDLVISYMANNNRTLTLEVNGVAQTINVTSTGKYCYQGGSPGTHTLNIPLNAGVNTIKFYDSPILDKISLLIPVLSVSNIEKTETVDMVMFPNSIAVGQDVTVRLNNAVGNSTSQVAVFDLMGRTVIKPLKNTSSTFQIPTSTLSNSGIYLVKVTIGNKSMVKRLVVK